jgi:hypothetical protein
MNSAPVPVTAARVKTAAERASEEALALAPQLEETRFARAWALQIDERWEKALEAYEAVTTLEGEATAPGERMKSFAENNAAWILLTQLDQGEASLRRAESLLWRAVARYPNKIAYANQARAKRIAADAETRARLADAFDEKLRAVPATRRPRRRTSGKTAVVP